MTFRITTMTPQAQWRTFGFQHHDLEEVYSILRTIVQSGDTLVNVTLFDRQGYLPLPLSSLETAEFVNPGQALRQQWETLLAQPVRGYLSKEAFRQHLLRLRENQLGAIRQILGHTQTLIERSGGA